MMIEQIHVKVIGYALSKNRFHQTNQSCRRHLSVWEWQDTKRPAGVFPYMDYYVRGYAAGLGMVYALSVLKGVHNYRKSLS